ncbi:unnamed protein product [Adineta steineri]|uniref:Uncharacterized protein n=1 Tax=Adineta steineri TaxID=433720 RepID=A0A814JZV4_9BILA|nr:unnamed protein product [Adineta steineri]CAF1044359.1 unnamed protein product [Adineta steineri]
MAQQRRYKLEQPRDFSNTSLYFTDLTTTPKTHHLHGNNYEQLNADSTFRPIVIDLKAARGRRHSYEIALQQQQSLIIPHNNQPHVNEDHYFTAFNEYSTNKMIIKEKNRRLENKRQHRSSKYSRSDPSYQISSDGVCCCSTGVGSNMLNSDEDGCCECEACCNSDSCDCCECDCDCCDCNGCDGDCCDCSGCDCGGGDFGGCDCCLAVLACCLLGCCMGGE